MPYVKNNSYRDIPFSSETHQHDFFTYSDLEELAMKSNAHQELTVKCRTVAVLISSYGKFYLTQLENPKLNPDERHIRVSMVHMKHPVRSTVLPYPVQIFGTLQWKNRPVIFANIIQLLTPANALRLRNALSGVTCMHLANNTQRKEDYNGNETSESAEFE